jgi:methionine synthase II (cobalamin-independent)
MLEVIRPLSTTGIGSLPHKNPGDACDLILKTFDIPFWPQLPNISFKESMIAQYSEGMPFIRINDREQTAWVIRDGSDELERFYESCSEDAKIAISEDYSIGFHTFLKKIKNRRFRALKGHITGPATFTLGLKDNFGRLLFFDEELREISLMLLQAKARWQIDMLKQHADAIIIFIDEPTLSAIGSSSYLGVDSTEILRLLKETVSAIENAGGISGIHCCGRADWPMVIKSGVRILSFDAFGYFDTLAIYHEDIKSFLKNGGYLAWGIVPTSDAINSVDDKYINKLMDNHLKKLYEHIPSELVNSQILITPSCGTGSRNVEETIKVFQLIMRLKEAME